MDEKPQKCHLRWASFAIEVLFGPSLGLLQARTRGLYLLKPKPETQSFEMKNELRFLKVTN